MCVPLYFKLIMTALLPTIAIKYKGILAFPLDITAYKAHASQQAYIPVDNDYDTP
jgi:hypothetical protein